ncbi:MAG: PilZ domain-containing protein [Pyrinomonadaceae bacterium]
MKYERRGSPRVKVNLPVRWEGVLTSQTATITSLSESGCFILTGGKVEPKELIRLEIELPDDKGPVYLWSEVVDQAYEIGFAARFTAADDEDNTRLLAYIQKELVNNQE